jgi:hypothetical protein
MPSRRQVLWFVSHFERQRSRHVRGRAFTGFRGLPLLLLLCAETCKQGEAKEWAELSTPALTVESSRENKSTGRRAMVSNAQRKVLLSIVDFRLRVRLSRSDLTSN